jgi:hypothetical protein
VAQPEVGHGGSGGGTGVEARGSTVGGPGVGASAGAAAMDGVVGVAGAGGERLGQAASASASQQ